MKLDVHERIVVLSLLPAQGDYAALKTLRRAKEMISFTPEETAFYELKNATTTDGKPQVVWNKEKAAQAIKDVPIDEFTTNLIRDALADLNKKGKLSEEHLSVYEKFIVMYQ